MDDKPKIKPKKKLKKRTKSINSVNSVKLDLKKVVADGELGLLLWGKVEKDEKEEKTIQPDEKNDGPESSIENVDESYDSKTVWNHLLLNRRARSNLVVKSEFLDLEDIKYASPRMSFIFTEGNPQLPFQSFQPKAPTKRSSFSSRAGKAFTAEIDQALMMLESEVLQPETPVAKENDFDIEKSLMSLEFLPTMDVKEQSFKNVHRKRDKRRKRDSKRRNPNPNTIIQEVIREEDDTMDEDDFDFLDDNSESRSEMNSSEYETSSITSSLPPTVKEIIASNTPHKEEHRIASVDIVSELFEMSNELRIEREKIITRDTASNDSNAFIDRDVTLKYNAELDEAKERINEAEKLNKRAQKLRSRNISIDVTDMSMFWAHVLKKQTTVKKKVNLKSAAKSLMGMGVMKYRRDHPLGKLDEHDDVSTDEGDEEDEEEDGTEGKKKTATTGAESILEENLGLLLKTKIMAADERKKSRRNAIFTLPPGMNSLKLSNDEDKDKDKEEDTFGRLATLGGGGKDKAKLHDLEVKKKLNSLISGKLPDYSDIKSRLYEDSNKSAVTKKIFGDRRDKLRLLVTQIATLNGFNTPEDMTNDIDTSVNDGPFNNPRPKSPEKIVYKVKNKIIYENYTGESRVKYHPYYKLYAGSGRWGMDPELNPLPQPYVPKSSLELSKNKKQKLIVKQPIKIKSPDCDEVIFDFSRFDLLIRSIRNGLQYDVTVGLDTLYVSECKSHNDMVTIRSSLVQGGYITTIKLQDWARIANQIMYVMNASDFKSKYFEYEEFYYDGSNSNKTAKLSQNKYDASSSLSSSIYKNDKHKDHLKEEEEEDDDDEFAQKTFITAGAGGGGSDFPRDSPRKKPKVFPIPPLESRSFPQAAFKFRKHQQQQQQHCRHHVPKVTTNTTNTTTTTIPPSDHHSIPVPEGGSLHGSFIGSSTTSYLNSTIPIPINNNNNNTANLSIPTDHQLMKGGVAFNESTIDNNSSLSSSYVDIFGPFSSIDPISSSCDIQDTQKLSAESLPSDLFKSLNVRRIQSSISNLFQPRSWERPSLYEKFQRKKLKKPHQKNGSKFSHENYTKLDNNSSYTGSTSTIPQINYKINRDIKTIGNYVLDDEWDPISYSFNVDKDLSNQDVRNEIEFLIKNPIRAGDPIFPVGVVGAAPPKNPVIFKSPNKVRRALTRQEIHDKYYGRAPENENNNSQNQEKDEKKEEKEEKVENQNTDDDDDDDDDYYEETKEIGNNDIFNEMDDDINFTDDLNEIDTAFNNINLPEISTPSTTTLPPISSSSSSSSKNNSSNKNSKPSQSISKQNKPKGSSEGKAIMIVESRRLMQLYFAKKFLQLDLLVDVHSNRKSAAKALLINPNAYSLVFVSYLDLINSGNLRNSLYQLVNPAKAVPLNKKRKEKRVRSDGVDGNHNDDDDGSEDESDEDFDKNVDWRNFDPNIFNSDIALVVYGDINIEDTTTSNNNNQEEELDSTDVSEDSNSDEDQYEFEDEEDKKSFIESRLERRFNRNEERQEQEKRRQQRILNIQRKIDHEEDVLTILEDCKVFDLLDEPYTLANIRKIISAHSGKQDFINT